MSFSTIRTQTIRPKPTSSRTPCRDNKSRSGYIFLSRIIHVAVLTSIFVCTFECVSAAQTIRVDATPSHAVNKFSPPYALGTTVDRVPSNFSALYGWPIPLQDF
jgi:hypothetical protein